MRRVVPTLDEAIRVILKYRQSDYRRARGLILSIAGERGEWHGDYMDEFKQYISSTNAIGVAVLHLEREGFIEKTGERRPLTYSTGHHRMSDVYRLTDA